MTAGPSVAFDASWIGVSGIGRFAREVLTRRPSWLPINQGVRAASPLAPLRLGAAVRRAPHKPDLLVSPGYIPPIGSRLPFAVTLHDLMYLEGGANFSPIRAKYFQVLRRRLTAADCVVLTVSEYSRQRILDWTEGQTEVFVVGNGVSAIASDRELPRKGDDHPRLLIVASERPNKNLPRQLRAADRAMDTLNGQIDLVLPAPPSAELIRQIDSMKYDPVVLVSLSEADLWDRYRTADVLLTASLEEGFGLPAIEAMAACCPVVYSDAGGLAEVVDGCGVLVDPLDEAAIADGILSVFDDDVATRRFVEAAYQRSQHFTWDRVVRRIDHAITHLVGQS